jgi:cytidine deaminase
MISHYDELIHLACVKAIDAIKNAHASISGVRVGAAVVAYDKTGRQANIFTGCNIEYATSRGDHAESVARVKAISEGYPIIKAVIVTSNSDSHQAAMCGFCMQEFSYCAPDCEVIVVRLDGSQKLRIPLAERNGKYGYYGKGRLQI